MTREELMIAYDSQKARLQGAVDLDMARALTDAGYMSVEHYHDMVAQHAEAPILVSNTTPGAFVMDMRKIPSVIRAGLGFAVALGALFGVDWFAGLDMSWLEMLGGAATGLIAGVPDVKDDRLE